MLALKWCRKTLRGGRECTPSSPPVSPWRRRGTAEGKRRGTGRKREGEGGKRGRRETEQGKKERRGRREGSRRDGEREGGRERRREEKGGGEGWRGRG